MYLHEMKRKDAAKMKRKIFSAILCAAILACSVTVYAEPEVSQVSGNTTTPPTEEGSGDEDSETTPDLRDVFLFIASSPQRTVNINDIAPGSDITFAIEVHPTFTPEWEGSEVVSFKISASETSDDSYSITDDKVSLWDVKDSTSYSFYISSITISKDGTTLTYDLGQDEFGYGTTWTFVYTAPEEPSSSVSDNDVNYPENSEDDSSSDDRDDETAEEEPVAVVKNVVSAGGTDFTSTVSGVYIPDSVDGVAVTSSYEAVCAAAGVNVGTADAGRIVLYVCDNNNEQEQAVFSDAAKLLGTRMISMIDVDMYHFIQADCRTVTTLETPIEITVALPEWAVRQGGTFSILCADAAGNLIDLPDTDTNANTVTVSTNILGAFAIVVR